MEPRRAEMGGNRGAEFQRRTQKHFLQRSSVRVVVARLARRVVIQNRLIFFSGVIVFRGKYFSVTGGLPVYIFFLFQQDAEGVALARFGIKIQIVTKDFRIAHSLFRRLSVTL